MLRITLAELLLQDFLSNVGLVTLPLIARAVVVGVFLLLQLGDQSTSAVPTLNQIRKGETVFRMHRLLFNHEVIHAPPDLDGNCTVEMPIDIQQSPCRQERILLPFFDASHESTKPKLDNELRSIRVSFGQLRN